ncbi:MAG: membrane protein insertase YidC [Bdellovibrio sp.]
MQQKNDNPSLFEPKTIIAIAAVALVYFGWQNYLTKKYPSYGKKTVQTEQTAQTTKTATTATPAVESAATVANIEASRAAQEKTFKFSNDKVSFVLSNYGMGLKDFTVNNYEDKENNKIKLGVSDKIGLFEMRWVGDSQLVFNVSEQAPGHYVGTAQVGNTVVKRELKFNVENNSFENTITISNPTEEVKKGFSLLVPEKIYGKGKSSFLFPSYQHQDFFVIHDGGKEETVNFNNAKENVLKEFPAVSVLSVSSQYFAASIKDKSDIAPTVKVTSQVVDQIALAELNYKPIQLNPEIKFSNILYAGPKSIDTLKSVDPELAHIIDFGFFGFIARPLLYVMKGFHSVVGNWGWAIILLTLLVRLCVLPFNIMSFKSMKAMQKVQPVIQSLREKYKDDPMRLNQEMMVVMKQHGANPVGGCLPMLLQIPVFFALYRVIGSSIELYNSPFILWIHNLSAHDPYYVLPVLMAVFMFIQQKLTPSTMDPTQAKIMAFLPLIMTVFMLQLPSGLTLYMVVSTLFGITQQYMIMREKKA